MDDKPKKPKGLSVIIKPTHECNLRCKYCYVEETAESGRMDEKTLENAITKIMRFVGTERKPYFIWHGGEPLLMGVDFFRKVAEIEASMGPEFEAGNCIQTNGTLINDDLVAFCRESDDFRLGSSLDGPEDIHNQTRVYKDGRGSFQEAYQGITLAKEANVGGGAITILNKTNIHRIGELYEFFRNVALNVKFNPLIKAGNAKINFEDLGITPQEYGAALVALFELWASEPEETPIKVSPFDEMIGGFANGYGVSCHFSNGCQQNFISVGPTGEVYPCGRFDGIPEFRFGNINEEDMDTIMQSPVRQKLMTRSVETLKRCQPCEYNQYCNGGCMDNAYSFYGNPMAPDYYCRSYKMIFAHIKDRLEREVNLALEGGK